MIGPRWRKVLRDLWGNKVRTVLVVVSIAIGVFAIGMIVGTHVILQEDLSASYQATNPASAVLYPDPFDAELVEVIRKLDGVRDAEGRRWVELRTQVGPDQWKNMDLLTISDYDDIRLNKITPISGAWPPSDRGLLVERASLAVLNANVGDTIIVEAADGKLRELSIGGVVHDLNVFPVQFSGEPYGYITSDTLEWLGFSRNFNELHILVEGSTTNRDHIQAVADSVESKVEKSGRTVVWTWIPEPGRHPASEVIEPMLIILGVLGGLSLFASSFLVINIINGLLAQQTNQIGIMKAIGARRGQIASMYLGAVLVFGLLSLLIAIPLGGLAAYTLTAYIAGLINFDLAEFRIPLQSIGIMIAVGLIVPFLAAFYPILHGASITVREAIGEYGLGQGKFGSSFLDRTISWVTSKALALSRPTRISLRNTIRRKARLILTLFTLTLGGALFIAVLSVHASMLASLDNALAYFNYDVDVNFANTQRIEEIRREALQVPGVIEADSWIGSSARRIRSNGIEGPNISVLGTQADTDLIDPTLLAGRWLLPGDENAIILNTLVLKEEPDIQVGDAIMLKLSGRDSEWQVVGLVQGVMTGPIAYANRPYLARELRLVDRSDGVQVVAERHDPAFQAELARRLKDHFDSVGMRVRSTEITANIRESVEYQFNILVAFLAIMAILVACVGGLGLMGTMSINVLERTREIGVMRAVGASDGSIMRIVLVEGIFVGIISWFLGMLAAYPIGKLLGNAVGAAFFEGYLPYHFAITGAIGWLVVMLVIATVASLWPAWNATRLSVHQTLQYE